MVSLLPPSSDTSFHCGSAILSYLSSNLALLQNFITFGFVPVNSLFISRPHQTKFHVRQGNCFIFKLKLSSPSKFYNFWFCIGKLLVYKSPSSDKISRASGQLFHIQTQTLLTYHHYCTLTNYIHPVGLEPDVMRANLY